MRTSVLDKMSAIFAATTASIRLCCAGLLTRGRTKQIDGLFS
jgi:hypothetical protein